MVNIWHIRHCGGAYDRVGVVKGLQPPYISQPNQPVTQCRVLVFTSVQFRIPPTSVTKITVYENKSWHFAILFLGVPMVRQNVLLSQYASSP